MLDKQVNYNECFEGIIPKINHKFWLLSKIRYYMTGNMTIKVFKSMVAPYFDYGGIIFMEGNKG